MIKRSIHCSIKWCLIGLCFFLLLLTPDHSYLCATETPHPSKGPFFAEALSWVRSLGKTLGLSSLEFEIHGISLRLSEIVAHLGHFLPSGVRDWNPSGEIIFDLKAAAATSHESGGTTLNLDLRLKDIAFSSPDSTKLGDHIEGRIHVTLTIPGKPDQPAVIRGAMSLERGDLVLGPFRFDLREDPVRILLLGSYDPQKDRLAPLSVHFHTPSLGEGTITGTLEGLEDPRGEVKIALGPISNERAFDLFVRKPFGQISPILREISINGKTRLTASIRGSRRTSSIQGLVEMSAVDLAIPSHEIEANGVDIQFPFDMEFQRHTRSVSRTGVNPSIDGFIRAERIKWRSRACRNVAMPVALVGNTLLFGKARIPILGGALALDGAQVLDPFGETMEVTLGLRLDRLDLSEVAKAVSPSFVPFVPPGLLDGRFSEIRISRNSVATRGSLTVHTLGGEIQVSSIEASTPFSVLPNVSMDVLIKDILLEEASLRPFLPAAILNWKLSGAMALDLAHGTGTAQEPDTIRVHARVRLKNGSFSSLDETILGEDIQGEAQVRFNIPSQPERPASFQGDLNLEAGEILLGSFYLNLQQDPLRLHTLGAYDAPNRRLPSLTVEFDAPTLGEATITAMLENLDDPQGEVKLTLGPIANKRAFELFVKEPFGHALPTLRDLSINGETRITALILGSRARYTLQGLLETSAEDLAIPAFEMKAKGVRIQLPVSLRHPEADRAVTDAGLNHTMTGFIKGEWIQWKSQEWRDMTVPLTLKANTLFLPPTMKLPLWGGTVTLKGVEIQDPLRKTRQITLGLRLDGLDLAETTRAFAPFALPGSLESDFSEIMVSQESLTTRGNLTIHALGGCIDVRNIQGATPFSRLREVSVDVLIRDLNLEEISHFFRFGQMGGVIEAEIRGLTLSFGQPEAFEIEIRSVKKRGVRQYVNADAVNDLSILSSGTPFSGRGALRFIKYFPYSQLGIYCKLENDVFTLRGAIHKRGLST